MDWREPYIIIRVAEGTPSVVHSATSLKDARYWLTYVAMNGDALFQTPAHPKYNGDGTPKYSAHLIKRGKLGYEEADWKNSCSVDMSTLAAPAA